MNSGSADQVFAGSVPELSDKYLVPLIFEMYAADIVTRLRDFELSTVLEVAAGSDVVVCHFGVDVLPRSSSRVRHHGYYDRTEITNDLVTGGFPSAALAERFGPVDLDSRIRGFVLTATKP